VKISLTKSLIVVLATSLLAASCFAADDPGDPSIIPWHKNKDKDKDQDKAAPKRGVSSSVKASETPIPRIWIGLTGSITPLRLLHTNASGNLQDAAGDALLATNNSGWVGGGLTLHVRITKSFWINVGGIYRYVGYDWMFNTTDLNEDAFAERSRLRMIDIPLLVRYTGKKWNPSKYTFYELGGTYRDVFSRVTTADQTAFASTAGIGPGISSGTAYHRTSYGATVGAGLIAKDDFGIIVSPEVRYTRWMGDTLGSNVIGTQKNQLEITLTFGF
jgi:hypothetical protein